MRVQVPRSAAERGRGPTVAPDGKGRRGRPLDRQERAQASAVFGCDFSGVRIHDDADLRGAEAATIGSRIFLRDDTAPDQRMRILGHELAHVVQQAPRPAHPGAPASKMTLEREADNAADAFAARQPARIDQHAPAQRPQFTPVTVRTRGGTRTFEVGDVKVNAAAGRDIRTHGNLLPSADQAHVIVHGNQLGYEPSYMTPEDPFRWNQFKAIVDNEHVDINAVSLTTSFQTNIVRPGRAPIPNPVNLASFAAGGFTLLTLAREQAINPGQALYVVSPDSARDKIYYETGPGGRGVIGSNSLAHELFGHFGLARAGAPFGHSATIPASAGVKDPFGQTYAGTVNDYIANFAGASGTIVQSPTFGVSASLLATALSNLQANGAAGLRGTRASNSWTVTPATDEIFVRISVNYRVLTQARVPATTTTPATPRTGTGPSPTSTSTGTPAATPAPATTTAPAVPTTASIESSVLSWYRGLTPDQRWVFQQYIADVIGTFLPTRPAELARAVQPSI